MISQNADGSVEFAFYRPGARTVRLAADFNQWDAVRHELDAGGDGWWRLTVALPVGSYRFKYIVDGSLWETDYAGSGVENDGLGGWNSLAVVEQPDALAVPKLEIDSILDDVDTDPSAVVDTPGYRGDVVVKVIDRDAELAGMARAADELHAARRAA